jgi:hypothetical protein
MRSDHWGACAMTRAFSTAVRDWGSPASRQCSSCRGRVAMQATAASIHHSSGPSSVEGGKGASPHCRHHVNKVTVVGNHRPMLNYQTPQTHTPCMPPTCIGSPMDSASENPGASMIPYLSRTVIHPDSACDQCRQLMDQDGRQLCELDALTSHTLKPFIRLLAQL